MTIFAWVFIRSFILWYVIKLITDIRGFAIKTNPRAKSDRDNLYN